MAPNSKDRGAEAADSSPRKRSDEHLSPNNVKNLAPTEGDIDDGSGSGSGSGSEDGGKKKSLKDLAESKLKKGNPTQLGDPVSLKAETSDTEPTEHDRGAQSGKKRRDSKL